MNCMKCGKSTEIEDLYGNESYHICVKCYLKVSKEQKELDMDITGQDQELVNELL